jgi:hypothetical protein
VGAPRLVASPTVMEVAREGPAVIRRDHLKTDGSVHSSPYDTGADAGLSERQIKDAVAGANLNEDTFEDLIESGEPPSVARIAALGRDPRNPPPPDGLREATALLGAVRRFAEMITVDGRPSRGATVGLGRPVAWWRAPRQRQTIPCDDRIEQRPP